MRIPTPDELIAAGEVLISWGSWIMVYAAITMFIGLAILIFVEVFNKQNIKFMK